MKVYSIYLDLVNPNIQNRSILSYGRFHFGNIFSITTWGESHGKGIGVVIDGCPAGLSLTEEDIQVYLNRSKTGTVPFHHSP
mgnify:CR=1 FL=1